MPGPLTPPFPTPSWLLVNEPSLGIVDRSTYLYQGADHQHSLNLQSRERGTWQYTLVSDPTDPTSAPAGYLPTLFQAVYAFDYNATGWTGPVFAGVVQDWNVRIVNGADVAGNGLRLIDVSVVSLEQVFDTIYADGTDLFINETCEYIFTALFNKYIGSVSLISLGTVSAGGVTVAQYNPAKGAKISELYQQLALTCEGIWGVNPQTRQAYLLNPLTTLPAAPFSLASGEALWDSISAKTDGADYRNRQAYKLSPDAFPNAGEYFPGTGQTSFTLIRPVADIVTVYVTSGSPNSAVATLSGQPTAGDTFTIAPSSGNWIASHIYGTGGVIVEGGYVFKVTTAGTSGGTQPVWGDFQTTGDTVADNTVIWTNQGPAGLGTGILTYEWVSSMTGYSGATGVYPVSAANPSGQFPTNAQFGQILIGANVAASIQNMTDAINGVVSRAGSQLKGVTYSLSTWLNGNVNALSPSGSAVTIQQSESGSGFLSILTTTGSGALTFNAGTTFGGTSPQTSVGNNEGATITIQSYVLGTSNAAPGLAYQPGSNALELATPLNSGTNLNVIYTAAGNDSIECEDTTLVLALAALNGGTGKIQQFTDQSSQGLISTSTAAGLQLCQSTLASFAIPPQELEVVLYRPGLLPGQLWTWALTGPASALNGQYYIEEVKAELVPCDPYLDDPVACPGGGHYKYTIRVITVSTIQNYSQFWRDNLGGGSGGGGLGSAVIGGGGASTGTGTGGGAFPFGGNGADGAMVLDGVASFPGMTLSSGVYTLNRDIYATTLVVNFGVRLITAWSRIFCSVSCTVNGRVDNDSATSILINGGNAIEYGPGGGGGGSTNGPFQTLPNTTGYASLPDIMVSASEAPPGQFGQAGTIGVGAAGTNGSIAAKEANYGAYRTHLGSLSYPTASGAAGGAGGAGGSGAGGAAGTGGAGAALTPYAAWNPPCEPLSAIAFRCNPGNVLVSSSDSYQFTVNSGNGAAAGGASGAGDGSNYGGGGGGSGGNGGAGEPVVIASPLIAVGSMGFISSEGSAGGRGGNGGDGGFNGSTGGHGNCGGGGGGGGGAGGPGGAVILVYSTLTVTSGGTIQAGGGVGGAGGAGGAAIGSGVAGSPGAGGPNGLDGVIYKIQV